MYALRLLRLAWAACLFRSILSDFFLSAVAFFGTATVSSSSEPSLSNEARLRFRVVEREAVLEAEGEADIV